MKTPVKIAIVAALIVTVYAVVVIKQGRSSTEPKGASSPWTSSQIQPGNNTGLPLLVDLGADKCIPCKKMAPILEQLKNEYAGRMGVAFIDVWKNPGAGKAYGIEVIPTQIFYDAEGKELFRHVGFFGKEDILGKWKELGVAIAESGK